MTHRQAEFILFNFRSNIKHLFYVVVKSDVTVVK